MTTCVVTGGAGFLGSHLCEHLLGKGHRVICIDNLDTGSLQNIEHIRDDDFDFVNHDITEYVEHRRAGRLRLPPRLAGEPDRLRAAAAAHAQGRLLRHPPHARRRQVQARPLPARLDLARSTATRRSTRSPRSYWGHVNPIGPRGVYDEAKRYAEALTMAYHRQQGVDTCIVRIFNTYGPRMRPHDGRAIPTFLRQALQDKPLTVFGDGSQTRSFCFVDDLVRGLVALAESDVHLPVNIGNPNEYTLLQLAEAVIEVTGSRSEIVFEALPIDDPQVRQPDITEARELLGWEPQVGLDDGLRRRSSDRASSASSARPTDVGGTTPDRAPDCDLPALSGRGRQHRVPIRPRAGGARPPRRGLHRRRAGRRPGPGRRDRAPDRAGVGDRQRAADPEPRPARLPSTSSTCTTRSSSARS